MPFHFRVAVSEIRGLGLKWLKVFRFRRVRVQGSKAGQCSPDGTLEWCPASAEEGVPLLNLLDLPVGLGGAASFWAAFSSRSLECETKATAGLTIDEDARPIPSPAEEVALEGSGDPMLRPLEVVLVAEADDGPLVVFSEETALRGDPELALAALVGLPRAL
mmetsp:Transcript_4205/g.6637  ORF Transcript_4205/g.6637 Transcript_4205/m.6637 type:complete len:162 (-) Transcript_4205:86-571(-)|eukprot:CAMPEP_0184301560 /NCGR_PEP_ID=MMETSP1049-20130417/11736_1 /TAXON_ID=77928 /ORGANISM="Proteomonas sulcata, Strain CCMP704" /LENGTH=161 /DNA_ID=CAMNT_0026612591 /DNA_START=26 /DNA_END=511 /DNA_ORIENTATION=-